MRQNTDPRFDDLASEYVQCRAASSEDEVSKGLISISVTSHPSDGIRLILLGNSIIGDGCFSYSRMRERTVMIAI